MLQCPTAKKQPVRYFFGQALLLQIRPQSSRLLGKQWVAAGKGSPKDQQRRSFQNGAFAQSAAIGLDYLSGSGIVFPAEKHHSVKSQLARFFQTQPEKLCADAAAPAVREAGAAVIVRFGQLQPLDSIAEQLRCDVSKIGGAR